MKQHEQHFTQGFNNGYLIAKHEPELYTTLAKGLDSKNGYLDGWLSGGEEYEREKHTPLKNQSKERNKDIDKDR